MDFLPDMTFSFEILAVLAVIIILIIKMPLSKPRPIQIKALPVASQKTDICKENHSNLDQLINLRAGSAAVIKGFGKESYVKQIILQARVNAPGLQLKIFSMPEMPSIIKQPPVGDVYKYVEILAEKLYTWNIDYAQIQFIVDRDWLTRLNIPEEGVIISRYYGGKWSRMKPRIVGREGNDIIYEVGAEGLFTFAISGETRKN